MIRVELSRVCDELRPVVLEALKQYDANADEQSGFIVLQEEISGEQVKQVINDALAKNDKLDDYVLVEKIDNQNEIAILKKGDFEQLGLHLCGYCGMVFGSEIEKNIHQRVHYFGFG